MPISFVGWYAHMYAWMYERVEWPLAFLFQERKGSSSISYLFIFFFFVLIFISPSSSSSFCQFCIRFYNNLHYNEKRKCSIYCVQLYAPCNNNNCHIIFWLSFATCTCNNQAFNIKKNVSNMVSLYLSVFYEVQL